MVCNKRNGFLLISFILIFTIALTGCQSDDKGSKGGNAAEGDVIELTLWNTWTDEATEGETAKERVEAFNESQDKIKINLDMTAHDQYKTKLKTQAAGKQLPELIQVWPGAELEPLASGGVLKPIDSIKDHWDDLIPENTMNDYAYDGKQYAVPGTMSYTSIVFYDKDKLQEAGFNEFPSTYEDFKELVANLKENGETPIQLGNKEKWVLQSVYLSTIADRITGSDYLANVLDGKAKFTDESFVHALSIIDELNKLGAFNEDMNTIDRIQALDNFVQDDGAMLFSISTGVGPLVESLPEDKKVGVAIFPEVKEGKGNPAYVSGISSVGIALNNELNEEEEAAAHEFLKFFYSEELYTKWIEDGLMVPADIEVPSGVDELTKQVLDITQAGIAPVYDGVLEPEVVSILNNGLQAITTESKTPENIAKEMQKELDQ